MLRDEAKIIQGDCLSVLPTLPKNSVQCVVTSPPYFNLRSYSTVQWIGGSHSIGANVAGARSNAGTVTYGAAGTADGRQGCWRSEFSLGQRSEPRYTRSGGRKSVR